MNPIQPFINPGLHFQDDTLRRELNAGLIQLQSAFDAYECPERDKLTKDLIEWLKDFKKELRINANAEIVQKIYLKSLQKLLIEPICSYPLTLESFLGSDGCTYDKKTLCMYLKSCGPNTYQYLSPVNFQYLDPLTIIPHKIAPMMVKWLNEKQGEILDLNLMEEYANVVKEYEKMVADNNLPYFPLEQNEPARLMRQRLVLQREKRELKEKLIEFGNLLQETAFNDSTTESLKLWHQLSTENLEINPNFNEAKNSCIEYLLDLLKDPISSTQLEEEAYLGSDGLTYSKKSLTIYLNEVQEPYCFRSPKFPENDQFFTVKPHLIVSEMVKWLKKLNKFTISNQIEEFYQIIIQRNNFKKLPTEENLYIDHLNNEYQNDLQQQAINLEAFEQQALLRILRQAEDGFNEVNAQIDADGEEFNELLQQAGEIDAEALQGILEAVELMDRKRQDFQNRAEVLRAQQIRIDVQLDVAQHRLNEVNIAINEARAAIKERDKGMLSSILTMVAIIAVSCLLPEMMSLTANNGRFMLGLTGTF